MVPSLAFALLVGAVGNLCLDSAARRAGREWVSLICGLSASVLTTAAGILVALANYR